MLLAHLSDPHLTAGVLAAGPARALHTALGRAAALDVDPVVITGDLVEKGTPGRMGYLDEPPGLLLHQLDERTGGLCITHAVPVEASAPLFPLPR